MAMVASQGPTLNPTQSLYNNVNQTTNPKQVMRTTISECLSDPLSLYSYNVTVYFETTLRDEHFTACFHFLELVCFALLVSAPMYLLAYIVFLLGHSSLKWTFSATQRMFLNYLTILRQSYHLNSLNQWCNERFCFMMFVFLKFRPFLLSHMVPILVDYSLFYLDNIFLDQYDMLHDPNNSYFLHITCLNTDLVTIYRHLITTLLKSFLKCQLVKPSAHPRQLWSTIFDLRRQVKSDQYSITNNRCVRGEQSDLDSSSELHARAKQLKTNVCKPVYSTSVPSPFVLSLPRSLPRSSIPLRKSFASPVCFHVPGGKSRADGDGSGSSTPTDNNDSKDSTSQDVKNGSGNSNHNEGQDSSSSGPQDKGDSDDDDDNPNKSGRESFKDASFSPDQDNKDEESEETEPASKEPESSMYSTNNISDMETPEEELPSLNQDKNNYLTSTLTCPGKLNFGPEESEEDLHRRLTPTEDNLSFCDEITSVRRLNTLPIMTGLNDPVIRMRNLSSSPGYTSVSSVSDSAELRRDIFHCKSLFPKEPANILYWSTDSEVSFRKYGIHQREFCLFSSRYYPCNSWDTYDAKEFKEVPILLQCMNQIISDHRIDENPSLNSCVVEKIRMNEHTPESTVFPSDLDSYAEDNSVLAILCLGQQNAIDVIPKSHSGSLRGKVEAGRLSPDHGAAVFLSKDALKRYEVRSGVGIGNSLKNDARPSYRLIFFRSKIDADGTLLWDPDSKDIPNESIRSSRFCNTLSYRMGQVHIYQQILDKLTAADFTLILDAMDQSTSSSDSLNDMKTRTEALLADPYSPPSYAAVSVIITKMKLKEAKEELTACNQENNGVVALLRQRLCRYLTRDTDQSCDKSGELLYSPEPPLSETAPVPNSVVSPTEFCFTSSLPSAKDFMRSKLDKHSSTQQTSKTKRKRQSADTKTDLSFQGLEIYIKSLESATENELTKELGFLKLGSEGSSKIRKKRITQHLKNPNLLSAASSSATSEQLNDVQNRLEVMERSNMSISSILTEIKNEMKELKLTITENTSGAKSTGECQMAKKCSSGTDLLKSLTKATQDTSLLLEKSEKGLKGLTQTLKDTMTVKKDLDVWRQSVFKREESDKINEIHNIISTPNFQEILSNSQLDPNANVSQDHVRHVPRSPADTRTNRDTPGLSPNQGRSSYRREGIEPRQRDNRTAVFRLDRPKRASNRPVPRQKKIVLLCDSTMRSFKSEEFPKRYNVSVIYKRSLKDFHSSLESTVEQISNLNPDAVYIHLGTQDILEGTNANSVVGSLIKFTEKILRQTSQHCQIFISHPFLRDHPGEEWSKSSRLITETIRNLKGNSEKADFWMRSRENKNNNFYPGGSDIPHDYLFVPDQPHLNDRGIRVIMGNFKTSLNSTFSGDRT